MTRPALTIRLPEPDDAPALAAVHVRSWRETYAGMLPERFYDETAQWRRRTMWDGLLRDEAGRSAVRVAEVAGRIVGFAAAGAPEESQPARETALRMVYVLREHHGGGAGQALLDAALGAEPAQLWVAAANARAIRFYERNGFRADGTETVDPRLSDLRELRMVR